MYFRVTISLIVAAVYVLVVDDGPDDVVPAVTDIPNALIDPDHPLLQVSFPIKRGKF